MSSLFEITADLQRLMDLLEDPDSEIDDQAILDTWEGLEGEFNDKVEGWLKVIRNFEGDVKLRKEEIARQQEKVDRDQRNIERMKSTIKMLMEQANVTKAGTAILSASIAKNGGKCPLVWADGVKEDPSLLPDGFKVSVTTWKADTDAIRAALDAGEKISGVEYGERGTNLRIK